MSNFFCEKEDVLKNAFASLIVDDEKFTVPVGNNSSEIVQNLSSFKHVSEGLKDPKIVEKVKKISGYFESLISYLDPNGEKRKEARPPYPPLYPEYIPYYAINILAKGYEIEQLIKSRIDLRRRKNVTIHSHVYLTIDSNTYRFLRADLICGVYPEKFVGSKRRVHVGFKTTSSNVEILHWTGSKNVVLPKLCSDPFWFLVKGNDGLGRLCRAMVIKLKLIYVFSISKLIITFDYITWGYDFEGKKWNIK